MRTVLALLVSILCAACAHGPDETAPALDTSASADIAPQTMVLRLKEPTPDSVTSQIVAAAHEHLAAACAQQPIAFVRVHNPLASGAYVDVPCTEIMGTGEATGEADETLASERTGQAKEPLTPIGALACALISAGPGFVFTWPGRGCERARAPRDRRACENMIGGWTTATIFVCGIAALF